MTEAYELGAMPEYKTFAELAPINAAHVERLVGAAASEIPSVFNLPRGRGHKKNVYQYKKDRGNIHSTQKPVALLVDIIRTYTRVGDTVLDWTAGSAATAVACAITKRNFKGWEKDAQHYADAVERLRTWIAEQPNSAEYRLFLGVGGERNALSLRLSINLDL